MQQLQMPGVCSDDLPVAWLQTYVPLSDKLAVSVNLNDTETTEHLWPAWWRLNPAASRERVLLAASRGQLGGMGDAKCRVLSWAATAGLSPADQLHPTM